MRLKSATGVWGRPADLQKRLDMLSPVEVVYDPSKITYGHLLRILFSVAPTIQRNSTARAGDVGTSYRSAIVYVNDD